MNLQNYQVLYGILIPNFPFLLRLPNSSVRFNRFLYQPHMEVEFLLTREFLITWEQFSLFSFLKPLSPGIVMQILLTGLHTFYWVPMGRTCVNIERIHLWWSLPEFSWHACVIMQLVWWGEIWCWSLLAILSVLSFCHISAPGPTCWCCTVQHHSWPIWEVWPQQKVPRHGQEAPRSSGVLHEGGIATCQ